MPDFRVSIDITNPQALERLEQLQQFLNTPRELQISLDNQSQQSITNLQTELQNAFGANHPIPVSFTLGNAAALRQQVEDALQGLNLNLGAGGGQGSGGSGGGGNQSPTSGQYSGTFRHPVTGQFISGSRQSSLLNFQRTLDNRAQKMAEALAKHEADLDSIAGSARNVTPVAQSFISGKTIPYSQFIKENTLQNQEQKKSSQNLRLAQRDFELNGIPQIALGADEEIIRSKYSKRYGTDPALLEKMPLKFDTKRLAEPEALQQLAFAGLFGGLPSLAGGAAGGGFFGGQGVLVGSIAGQVGMRQLDQAIEHVVEQINKMGEAGLTFERSILGIASILQNNTQVFTQAGRPASLQSSLEAQQQKAIDIQLASRGRLAAIGISGSTEATLVQGLTAALGQRGILASPEQTAKIAERVGATILAQRPQLLENPTLLLRDIQDVFSGGPAAQRTLLSQVIKPSLQGIIQAGSAEDIDKATESLNGFVDAVKNSNNVAVQLNRLSGALDLLYTTAGSALVEQLTPGVKSLADALRSDDLQKSVKSLGEDIGRGLSGAIEGASTHVKTLNGLFEGLGAVLDNLKPILAGLIAAGTVGGVANAAGAFNFVPPLAGRIGKTLGTNVSELGAGVSGVGPVSLNPFAVGVSRFAGVGLGITAAGLALITAATLLKEKIADDLNKNADEVGKIVNRIRQNTTDQTPGGKFRGKLSQLGLTEDFTNFKVEETRLPAKQLTLLEKLQAGTDFDSFKKTEPLAKLFTLRQSEAEAEKQFIEDSKAFDTNTSTGRKELNKFTLQHHKEQVGRIKQELKDLEEQKVFASDFSNRQDELNEKKKALNLQIEKRVAAEATITQAQESKDERERYLRSLPKGYLTDEITKNQLDAKDIAVKKATLDAQQERKTEAELKSGIKEFTDSIDLTDITAQTNAAKNRLGEQLKNINADLLEAFKQKREELKPKLDTFAGRRADLELETEVELKEHPNNRIAIEERSRRDSLRLDLEQYDAQKQLTRGIEDYNTALDDAPNHYKELNIAIDRAARSLSDFSQSTELRSLGRKGELLALGQEVLAAGGSKADLIGLGDVSELLGDGNEDNVADFKLRFAKAKYNLLLEQNDPFRVDKEESELGTERNISLTRAQRAPDLFGRQLGRQYEDLVENITKIGLAFEGPNEHLLKFSALLEAANNALSKISGGDSVGSAQQGMGNRTYPKFVSESNEYFGKPLLPGEGLDEDGATTPEWQDYINKHTRKTYTPLIQKDGWYEEDPDYKKGKFLKDEDGYPYRPGMNPTISSGFPGAIGWAGWEPLNNANTGIPNTLNSNIGFGGAGVDSSAIVAKLSELQASLESALATVHNDLVSSVSSGGGQQFNKDDMTASIISGLKSEFY